VGSDKRIGPWRVALAEDGQGFVATTKRIPSWPAKTTRWLKRPHYLGRPPAKTPLSHPGEQLRIQVRETGAAQQQITIEVPQNPRIEKYHGEVRAIPW
jgi:hypothetical protein